MEARLASNMSALKLLRLFLRSFLSLTIWSGWRRRTFEGAFLLGEEVDLVGELADALFGLVEELELEAHVVVAAVEVVHAVLEEVELELHEVVVVLQADDLFLHVCDLRLLGLQVHLVHLLQLFVVALRLLLELVHQQPAVVFRLRALEQRLQPLDLLLEDRVVDLQLRHPRAPACSAPTARPCARPPRRRRFRTPVSNSY